MLCYAWDKIEYLNYNKVGQLEEHDLVNLFAKILNNELIRLVKKGFYREYLPHKEEMSMIRGKINFQESILRLENKRGKIICEVDELEYNILINQVIKTTILNLLKIKQLSTTNHNLLKQQMHYFRHLDKVVLTSQTFKNIRYNKSNYNYKFIINICRLIYNQLLLSEDGEEAMFYDFIDDEVKMARLFEEFVRNFYKHHLKDARVYRENIQWNMIGECLEYLPIMQTDISIEWQDKKKIVDTKYYKEALKSNRGNEKLISGNLYQIYSYLKNNENKSLKDKVAEGILLYPKVGKGLHLNYIIEGHKVSIYTLDLNTKWQDIHEQLLEIIA